MSLAQAAYPHASTVFPFAGGAQEGVHRFPPIVQVLVPVASEVRRALQQTAHEQFLQGKPLDLICWEVYNQALSMGYYATIGVQEVSSRNMPSFPGETVVTSLLLVDLRPIEEAAHPSLHDEVSALVVES